MPPTRSAGLTLDRARDLVRNQNMMRDQLRDRLRVPTTDTHQAARDAAFYNTDRVTDPALSAWQARVRPRVDVAVADVSRDALAQAAYDKRTGEWKVAATGGRRTTFPGASKELHDHHIDKNGIHLGRRKQQSNYFLTINTNKRRFDEILDTRAVEYAIHKCFDERLVQALTFGPVHYDTYGEDAKWPSAVIEKVDVKAGVERGPITGALHAHLYLTITHWSQLRINVPALQDLFKEAYNAQAVTKIAPRARPSIKIELLPQTDFGQIVAHYLSKQVAPTVEA